MSDPADRPEDRLDQSGEIVNPEDLPAQIELTEQAGVTRIDIAEDATTRPGDPGSPEDEHAREMSSPTEQLAPALEIDARLTEIERRVNLLVNVTPLNAAEAWADFERSDFGTAPTLRLRPLDFDPDLAQRDLYDLEVMPDAVIDRFCLFGPPEAHVARLEELRDLGVDQFAVYLQHDAKDETLQAYGEKVIPAIADTVRAKT